MKSDKDLDALAKALYLCLVSSKSNASQARIIDLAKTEKEAAVAVSVVNS